MKEYFEFLDALREKGSINMFGAAPVLARKFKLDAKQARDVTMAWMKTFDGESTVDERVARIGWLLTRPWVWALILIAGLVVGVSYYGLGA
jgi:hypothetical protein